MPNGLVALCASGNLSTWILILAVIAYLPNLYFNSNSTVFRKPKQPPSNDTQKKPIAFSRLGVIINAVISILALGGIILTITGC